MRYRSSGKFLTILALFLAISQSDETVDTLVALRLAKEKGLKTLAVVPL